MGLISQQFVPLSSLSPPIVINLLPTNNFLAKLPTSGLALVLAYSTMRYTGMPRNIYMTMAYSYTLLAVYGAVLNKLIYDDGFLLPW